MMIPQKNSKIFLKPFDPTTSTLPVLTFPNSTTSHPSTKIPKPTSNTLTTQHSILTNPIQTLKKDDKMRNDGKGAKKSIPRTSFAQQYIDEAPASRRCYFGCLLESVIPILALHSIP